eukprot:569062-Pelagomonas_calceolata.AAC.6
MSSSGLHGTCKWAHGASLHVTKFRGQFNHLLSDQICDCNISAGWRTKCNVKVRQLRKTGDDGNGRGIFGWGSSVCQQAWQHTFASMLRPKSSPAPAMEARVTTACSSTDKAAITQ